MKNIFKGSGNSYPTPRVDTGSTDQQTTSMTSLQLSSPGKPPWNYFIVEFLVATRKAHKIDSVLKILEIFVFRKAAFLGRDIDIQFLHIVRTINAQLLVPVVDLIKVGVTPQGNL